MEEGDGETEKMGQEKQAQRDACAVVGKRRTRKRRAKKRKRKDRRHNAKMGTKVHRQLSSRGWP